MLVSLLSAGPLPVVLVLLIAAIRGVDGGAKEISSHLKATKSAGLTFPYCACAAAGTYCAS